ncbi:MAG: ECF transporter S component [Ruminococcus sp.]|nr:ECF transporter S component [Ruminococcus sp.]
MTYTTASKKRSLVSQLALSFAGVASAVLLPQVFHAIGVISGTGAALGSALLPMQIPVLLAGILGGPVVGLIVGLLSPVLSFAISGMPTAALLPFMAIELGVYGLTAGLLARTKINRFVQLLITQTAGRAARVAAVLGAIALFDHTQFSVSTSGAFITAGAFGILLQWALIPLLCPHLEKLVHKQYD